MDVSSTVGVRTGVDIIEIRRIERAYMRRPELFCRRFFTEREQKQLFSRRHAVSSIAARFAAKEAISKLLGMGIGRLSWTDIEILSLTSGEPQVHLHNQAAARAGELSLSKITLSLSHCREYAVAQAVALILQNPKE